MGVPKRGTDHCIMKSSFASQLPSGANRHLLSLSSYFPSSLVRVLATMALICFRRSLVAVLFVMVVACSSVTAVSAVKPLKLTSRSDFGILEPENLVNRHAEVWLCPYAYSSVPIEPTNPSLVQLLGNLTQLINSQFNYTQYGGSAVMTYRGSEIWSWAKGTNPATGQRITPDSIFRIGSVTKLFTALLTLLGESQRLISLDDPVKEYITDLNMVDPFHDPKSDRSTSFTWRQMASHTAGIPREAPCLYHSCQRTDQEMMARLAKTRLILPAASRPSYSNLGYAMLGHFISKVFGQPFESLVGDILLKPLEMGNSSLTSPKSGSYVPPVPNAPLYDLGWVAPSGQMFSTARDLSKLAIALNLASSEPFLFGNPRVWEGFGEADSESAAEYPTMRSRISSFHIGSQSFAGATYMENNRNDTKIGHMATKYEKQKYGEDYFKRLEEARVRGGMKGGQERSRLLELFKYSKSATLAAKGGKSGIHESLLREMMYPTYVNTDGTGYGMPWEFEPLEKYWVRNKGANLQGYSTNIALIPELQLSLTITTNLNVDSTQWATELLRWFVPQFEDVLEPLQSMPARPGNYARYVGKYEPATEIALNQYGYLVIKKLRGMDADIPLVPSAAEPNNPSVLQLYVPQMALPCMTYEFLALAYEYIEFKLDSSGKAVSFNIPGLMYSSTYTRIS